MRIKIFTDDSNYLPREHKAACAVHTDLSVQTDTEKHSGWEEKQQIFDILQDNPTVMISAVPLDRAFCHAYLCAAWQTIKADDYQLHLPRISPLLPTKSYARELQLTTFA